jgi:integrase
VLTRLLASLRRKIGAAPRHQKAPVDDRELAALLGACAEDVPGLRDRALLALGWLGAFRRSELVALRVEDITRAPTGGLQLFVRSSKTDQDGVGAYVGIAPAATAALCAVRALDAWLAASGIREGFIFRAFHRGGRLRNAPLCDRAVAIIVKRAAARAGLDPTRLAGHSLRAGFATTASVAGKSKSAIAAHLRHKSESTTTRYVRPRSVLDANPTAGLV